MTLKESFFLCKFQFPYLEKANKQAKQQQQQQQREQDAWRRTVFDLIESQAIQ